MQNASQLPVFFLFLILSVVFGRTDKNFLANILTLVTTEVCDQDLTHSFNTPKNVSVKIVSQVVIRDAFTASKIVQETARNLKTS